MDDQSEKVEFQQKLVAAYPSLLRYAERLSHSRADAWDLVHETMERGLHCRASFLHGNNPISWLATILRRIFLDRCRRARVDMRLSRSWGMATAEAGDEPAAEAVWEAFSIEDVRRALLFLPPLLRTPYTLFAFERLSYAEVSERLSLPPGTIASRVFRARQRLRQLLTAGEFRLHSVRWRSDNHAPRLPWRVSRRERPGGTGGSALPAARGSGDVESTVSPRCAR